MNLSCNQITQKHFRNYLKSIDKQLYQKYQCNKVFKEAMKEAVIEQDIYKLLSLIKDPEYNFLSIDFFLNTTYGFKEIGKKAENILNIDDLKLLKRKITPTTAIKRFNDYDIQKLYDDNYIFNIDGNLVEVTTEITHIAINFLQENDIPISFETFKDTVTRYYQINFTKEKHR